MYVDPYRSGLQVEQKVPFTFASGVITIKPTSPMVESGAIMDSAWVRIDVPFDGGGASIALGTTGSPNLVIAPGEVTPSSANQYGFLSVAEFPVTDSLILTVVSGGSTQGSGLLVCRYRGPST